jgi:hypothetical protein
MIRMGSGAAVTPCSGQDLQARFSRLITLGDHPKAAIDDQVKSGHRETA